MSAVSWRSQNIKEGMLTWHGISTDNFVVNLKELTTEAGGTVAWKVKI